MKRVPSPARRKRNLFESKTQRLPEAVLRTDEFCAGRAPGEDARFIENPCEEHLSTIHSCIGSPLRAIMDWLAFVQ